MHPNAGSPVLANPPSMVALLTSNMAVIQPKALLQQAQLFLMLPSKRKKFFDRRYSRSKQSTIMEPLTAIQHQGKPLLKPATRRGCISNSFMLSRDSQEI